jgi:hypothetical protein
MNRAQLDRAEAVAQQLDNRRRLTETRVAETREALLDEIEEIEANNAASFLRRRVYVEQVNRFELYRQEAFAFLIAQGVVEDSEGVRAAEATPDRDRLAEFTEKQMELGRFLVSQ